MFLPTQLAHNERLHLQLSDTKETAVEEPEAYWQWNYSIGNSHLKTASPLMHQMLLLSLFLRMKRRKYCLWTCKTLMESSLVFTLQRIWSWPQIPNSPTSTSQELIGEQISSGDTAQHRLPRRVPGLAHVSNRQVLSKNYWVFLKNLIHFKKIMWTQGQGYLFWSHVYQSAVK